MADPRTNPQSRTARQRVRALARPGVLLLVLGALLVAGSAAYAAIVVHGRAELVALRAETAGLEVDDVRLSEPLTPGSNADLVFRVRNRGQVPVVADRVTAQMPLREADPAGCTGKVSGPLLASGGMRLTGGQRVVLRSGQSQEVTVPGALRLAASAKTGCGFRVTLDVRAVETQAPPTTVPTTAPTAPTVPPTTSPTTGPPTSEPPSEPTPTQTPSPPPDDCDPADPTCTVA